MARSHALPPGQYSRPPPPVPPIAGRARAYASSSSQGHDAVHQHNLRPRSPFQERYAHTHGRTKAQYMLDPSHDEYTFFQNNFASVDTKEIGYGVTSEKRTNGARTRRTTKTSLRPPVGVYLGHRVYVCWRRAEGEARRCWSDEGLGEREVLRADRNM